MHFFSKMHTCFLNSTCRLLVPTCWRLIYGKIPGLSEIFMYLNDDFVLMKPFDIDRIINAGPQVIVPSSYNTRWCQPANLKAESFTEGHNIDYTNTNNLFMSMFGYCIPYLNDDHRPYILSVSLNRYVTKRLGPFCAYTSKHREACLASQCHLRTTKRNAHMPIHSLTLAYSCPLSFKGTSSFI